MLHTTVNQSHIDIWYNGVIGEQELYDAVLNVGLRI